MYSLIHLGYAASGGELDPEEIECAWCLNALRDAGSWFEYSAWQDWLRLTQIRMLCTLTISHGWVNSNRMYLFHWLLLPAFELTRALP